MRAKQNKAQLERETVRERQTRLNHERNPPTVSSGNTNLALAVFSCLWESLIVFANDWVHFGV